MAVGSEKAGRKWYEAAGAGRKQARNATRDKGLESLERDQPGLVQTQRRLAGKEAQVQALEESCFDAGRVLYSPTCREHSQANDIAVDDSTSQGGPVETLVETVQITDIGSCSRKLIETSKRVPNLKGAMNLGMDMHKWLYEEGIPSLPADYHGLAKKRGDRHFRLVPLQGAGASSLIA